MRRNVGWVVLGFIGAMAVLITVVGLLNGLTAAGRELQGPSWVVLAIVGAVLVLDRGRQT